MRTAPLRIFIGYDSREAVAFHVLSHSILKRARGPVAITPLVQPALRAAKLYTRERGPTEATEFSMTRFLVPYLAGYEGLAVFMDCDMLVKCDIYELLAEIERNAGCAVWACQHDYTPKSATKMEGQAQTVYPRKNWSSLMVFDAAKCKALTLDYVNSASGLELHRFRWVIDDYMIGALPLEYNWLVGEYPKNPDAKIIHFTEGGPWFRDYRDVDYADEWIDEHSELVPRVTWAREAFFNSDLVMR